MRALPLVPGGTKFPSDPGLIWSELCESFELHTIRAEHRAMVRVHGDCAAGVLSRCLERAIDRA